MTYCRDRLVLRKKIAYKGHRTLILAHFIRVFYAARHEKTVKIICICLFNCFVHFHGSAMLTLYAFVTF